MKLKFYGASDDLFEYEVDGKYYEWGCYSSDDKEEVMVIARVTSLGGAVGVLVRAIYDGTWSFAVGKLGDERSLPEWTYGLGDEHAYSTWLTIDTDDDLVEVVRVEWDAKNGGWVPYTGEK